MKRGILIVLVANLIGLAVLTLLYPHLMVSPGKLIPGHKDLVTDCFACHTPFLGAKESLCESCHQPEQIGRLTSKGLPIVRAKSPVPFHQKLLERDCLACHTDHAGTRRFSRHERFEHQLLQTAARGQCQDCHKAPTDNLHRQIDGNCQKCHNDKKWTPATFDHGRYFVLDRDHNARCITCHQGNDFSRYTCYGCHEHTPANIRREHVKEGIGDYENCVECHRSGNKHDIRGGESGRGRHGERRGRDHDD